MASKDAQLDVFVGNISQNTTEMHLRDMFGVVGTVRSVRILIDKDTGRPKGYAFIEYGAIEFVHAAVRLLNNSELNGRVLRVSYASGTPGGGGHEGEQTARPQAGTVGAAVAGLQLHEAWDLLDSMKKLEQEQRLRPILEANPQLVQAAQEIKRRLGIV